jgi:hypothetical protein
LPNEGPAAADQVLDKSVEIEIGILIVLAPPMHHFHSLISIAHKYDLPKTGMIRHTAPSKIFTSHLGLSKRKK